jgi:5-dehydro-2-deoxygluconokinase
MGCATGAIVVTRQGCANDMPRLEETLAFIEGKGGF